MAKSKSHKLRAKELLESLGWMVADVETQHHRCGRRWTTDLWNFADLLAVKPGVGTLGLQVTSTSGGNVADRVSNVFASPQLSVCLKAGWRVEVWGIRNKPTKAGSSVLARSIELSDDGERVIAFEGSHILPKELWHGRDSHQAQETDREESDAA